MELAIQFDWPRVELKNSKIEIACEKELWRTKTILGVSQRLY